MKLVPIAVSIGSALALACAAAHAQVDAKKAEALAKDAGCLACHAIGSKKAGPSFKESAKKFKGEPDKLAAAVKANKEHDDSVKGVKDEDLKTIAAWISGM